jgi:CheY-like chemotaxis protein
MARAMLDAVPQCAPRETNMTRRVIIADDDPQTRELIRAALRPLNHEVRETSSGLELLEALAYEGPFDLIVTDLMMPSIDGIRVIAMARNAGVETPILVVTAYPPQDLAGDGDTATSLRWLGGATLIRKPFGLADLREAAAALLPPD